VKTKARRHLWYGIAILAVLLVGLAWPVAEHLLGTIFRHEPFYNGLPYSYWITRDEGFQELRRDGAPAVPVLMEALRNPERYVAKSTPAASAESNAESLRGEAIDALVDIGAPAATELAAALRDDEGHLRFRLSIALGRIGRPALAPLCELLHAPDVEVRFAATFGLNEIGRDAVSVAPTLVNVLNDANEDVQVRRFAAFTLGKVGSASPEAIPALVAALKSPNDEMRAAAVGALLSFGPSAEGAVGPLVEAFGDPKREVRSLACQTLGRIGRPAVPALIRALQDAAPQRRKYAVETLALITPRELATVRALISLPRDPYLEVRVSCLLALGHFEEADAESELLAPALTSCLADPNSDVRWAAALSLVSIGRGRQAVPQLIESLSSVEAISRIKAATALGRIGPDAKAAIPALMRALNDRDNWLSREATLALRAIDPTIPVAAGKNGALGRGAILND